MSRCLRCGDVRVPDMMRCPACGSDDIGLSELAGAGRVLAITTVHTPAKAMGPWLATMIECDEGVRVFGLGAGDLSPGDAAVVVGEEATVPIWARASGSADEHGR